jgi:hypothetical protein
MARLNQVIGVEKGVKGQAQALVASLVRIVGKPGLFDGFTKTYQKRDEDTEDAPPQAQRVQHRVPHILQQLAEGLTELFDVTATKDYGNCAAKADLSVDGVTLLHEVPATYLLFLDKQLGELHAFAKSLPVLDQAEEWKWDEHREIFFTDAITTSRTKKTAKPIVLYEATDRHPAQTQLITEDVYVGDWKLVKQSGAVPDSIRRNLVRRVEKLQRAVKYAREQANMTDAVPVKAGEAVLGWLLEK